MGNFELTTQAPEEASTAQKIFRIPVSNGIFKHYPKLRDALWLLLWYVDRTTKEIEDETGEKRGVVRGGAPTRDSEIAAEISCEKRTICRWRNLLAELGYIEQRLTPFGAVVWVKKSKKWNFNSRDKNVPLPSAGGTRSVVGGTKKSRGGTRSALAKKTLQTLQDNTEKQEGAPRLNDEVLAVYKAEGIKPEFGPGERRRLDGLARKHTTEEIISALRLFLGTEDTWLAENRYPLNAFAKRFDALLGQIREDERLRIEEEFDSDFFPFFDPREQVEIEFKGMHGEWTRREHRPRTDAEKLIATGVARRSPERTLPTNTVRVMSHSGSQGWLDRRKVQFYAERGICTEV